MKNNNEIYPIDCEDSDDCIGNYKTYYTYQNTHKWDKLVDWILILLAIFLGVMLLTSCTKTQLSNTTTTSTVRVIVSVSYHSNDSIEYFTGGEPGIVYIKSASKEFDYMLTNPNGGSAGGSANYKYCNNTAYEVNSTGNYYDSIRMAVYVNGSLQFNQAALGTIHYQIQY